jgi:hypothetical protein
MQGPTNRPDPTRDVLAVVAELDAIAPIHRQKRLFLRVRDGAFAWATGRPDRDAEHRLRDAFTTTFLLGAVEPNSAAALALHHASLFVLANGIARAKSAATLVHVLRRRRVIASHDWGDPRTAKLVSRTDGDRRWIDGQVDPSALAPEADVAWLRAHDGRGAVLAFVELDADQAVHRLPSAHANDPSTRAEGRLVLQRASVPHDAVLLREGDADFARCVRLRDACVRALRPAAWLGAAQRALEEYRAHVLTRRAAAIDGDRVAALGGWLFELRAAAAASLEVLRLVAHAAFDTDPTALARAASASDAVAAHAPAVAERIVSAVRARIGAASLALGHPLERLSRDVRAATLESELDAMRAHATAAAFLRAGESGVVTPW